MNFAEIKELVSEPFFLNWFGINLGFLLVGLLLGRMFFTKGKSKQAYNKALDKARNEHEEEKKAFSNDVSAQLTELRNGILNSAQAYQKAIEVIGGHIGPTENLNFNKILIEENTESISTKDEASKDSIIEETVIEDSLLQDNMIQESLAAKSSATKQAVSK